MPDYAAAAKAALAEKRYNDACELADKALEKNWNNVKALEAAGFAANALSEWERAARYWSTLTKLQPQRAGPYSQALTAYDILGETEKAFEMIDGAIKSNPDNTIFRIEYIDLLGKNGREDEARAEAAQALELITLAKDFSALIRLGRWFASIGEETRALELFEQAKAYNPNSPDPKVYQARISYQIHKIDDAWRLWSEIQSEGIFNRPYEPAIFLARIAHQRGWSSEVEKYCLAAIDAEPHQMEPYKTLINLYIRQRRLPEAEALNERFTSYLPNDPRPFLTRALVKEYQKDIDAARELFAQTLKEWPDNDDVRFAYGEFLRRQRDHEQAVSFWREQTLKKPQNIRYHIEVLRVYVAMEDWARTSDYAENSILAIDPDNSEAMVHLASALRRLGESTRSAKVSLRGMEIHPDIVDFWQSYLLHALDIDNADDVIKTAEAAKKHFSNDNARDLYSLSRILLTAEMRDDAHVSLRKAIEHTPDDIRLHSLLGRSLLEQGDFMAAVPHARKIRQSNLQDPLPPLALAKAKIVENFNSGSGKNSNFPSLAPENVFCEIVNRATSSTKKEKGDVRNQVLIVTSTLGSGGAERQVAYTARGVKIVPHSFDEIEVLAEDLNPDLKRDFFRPDIEEIGTTVQAIRDIGGRGLARDHLAVHPEDRSDIILLETLIPELSRIAVPVYGYIKQHRPCVVHAWQDFINVAVGYAALCAGVPRIILSTRSTRPDARRRERRYLKLGYQLLMQRPEVIMLNNSKAGARDYEDWLELPYGTVGTIYNGLDLEVMYQRASPENVAAVREQLDFPEGCKIVGGVMRFSEEKRPDLWVAVAMRAAALDESIRFFIAGDGPMRPALEQEVSVAGLGDKIRFVGRQSPIEPWMANMDILFLSSRMEGLPNVLIEAQALGTVVASMAVGGAPEALKDGETGFLLHNPDPDEIARTFIERLQNEEWMNSASQAARDFVKDNFSIEAMATNTIGAYDGRKDAFPIVETEG